MKDDVSLKNWNIKKDALLKLGFTSTTTGYQYTLEIMDGKFLLSIFIDAHNIITSEVIERSNLEKYMLYDVKGANGKFVCQMRQAYDNVIASIQKAGCPRCPFQSDYANLVISYLATQYHDEPEYLWEKFPSNAIFRNKKNQKWYAVLLVVEKKKLGLSEEGTVEILDLLLEPDKIITLVDHKTYFGGYHMNKKHWFTIKLDKTVNIETIYAYLDHSYKLASEKRR